MRDVIIFKPQNGVLTKIELESYKISSIYNHEKINSLFKNFDTITFIELIVNYNKLLNNGYNKSFLNQSLHSMLSLPFFSIFNDSLSINIYYEQSLKKSDNFKLISLGLITCVLTFYFKDLSMALGQTDRIPLF